MAKIGHLQGIRGLAIFAVVLFHFISWDFPNGYLGVDIFFVLSGYLMAMILSKEAKFTSTTVTDFWYRRVKRIFPLYYLFLFLSTATLFIFSVPNLPAVLDSLINSLLFCTNMQSFTGYDYFLKLSAAFDLYTHTWSLCVEIQFYLIFPLLYFIHIKIPARYSGYHIPWLVPGILSLGFYFYASDDVAFNCALARLWQFVVGIMTFYITQEKKAKESSNIFISILGLAILCITLFSHTKLQKDYVRVITTVITSFLIAYGEGNVLLENKAAVFVGEVSYSWYLVHWPVVCYQKSFGWNQLYAFPSLIAFSFALAVLIHFTFEKHYLKWGYYVIFLTIFAFGFACMLMYVPLSGVTNREIARIRALSKNYTHLTKEEVMKFNLDLSHLDIPMLVQENCTFQEKPVMRWQGFCQYKQPTPTRGNNTLMVIGNSWAANIMRLVHEECSPYAKNISLYTVGGCDVLPDVVRSCSIKPKFIEYVDRVRPDVLYIIARTQDLKHVDEGMLPLEDSVFTSALARLQNLESLVKKKIFILNAFHNINPKITSQANEYLKYGQLDPNNISLDLPNGLKVARMRTEELVKRCNKCELFDYVPYLSINHRVTLYDPQNFVTFANSVLHITLPGQEKLRPLYRDMCSRLNHF